MSKHKHSVGNTSSRVSPPLGHLPDFEIKPLRPRSGGSSSPIREANERKRKGSRLSKDEALERREPVNSVTGHPWYHSLCCAISTAALHDRLFEANRCPYNGGLPSGPTVCFSPAAQGPVTETLCTALHHPAALCTQKKIVFSPSTHLRFVQSGFILAKAAAPVKKFGSH